MRVCLSTRVLLSSECKSLDTNLGQHSMMWFQTFVADLRFQACVYPAGRELRPSARRLLPLLLLPLQSLGVQLPLSAHGPLPEMGMKQLQSLQRCIYHQSPHQTTTAFYHWTRCVNSFYLYILSHFISFETKNF